jgi:hypothetical protein
MQPKPVPVGHGDEKAHADESAAILSDTMTAMDESLLTAALHGLEAERARIDERIAYVRSLMSKRGRGRPPKAEIEPVAKKRGLTAAGRRRLAELMRQRWAAKRTAAQAKARKKKSSRRV